MSFSYGSQAHYCETFYATALTTSGRPPRYSLSATILSTALGHALRRAGGGRPWSSIF